VSRSSTALIMRSSFRLMAAKARSNAAVICPCCCSTSASLVIASDSLFRATFTSPTSLCSASSFNVQTASFTARPSRWLWPALGSCAAKDRPLYVEAPAARRGSNCLQLPSRSTRYPAPQLALRQKLVFQYHS